MNINIRYRPHKYQRYIHHYADIANDDVFFITVIAGRQSGKTLSMEVQAIDWALRNPNFQIWIVSPIDKQSLKVYEEIDKKLKNLPIVANSYGSKGNYMIYFTNGSKIEFRSAKSKDNLRGPSVDAMILDEAALMDHSTVYEVLMPMLNVKGKKFLITTTPRGKSNWTYNMFLKGMDTKNNKKHRSLRFTSKDNPKSNDQVLEEWKNMMTEDSYRQEVLAEFVEGGNVFSGYEELIEIENYTMQKLNNNFKLEEGRRYYVGIDIGMQTDSTVIATVNDNGDFVNFQRFTGVGTATIKRKIKQVREIFQPRMMYIEQNGMGLPILSDLQNEMNELRGFTTTNSSKNRIIHRVIKLISERSIKLPMDERFYEELENFGFEYTQSGNLRFEAMGTYHDDIVMAFAIAEECLADHRFMLNSVNDIPIAFD